MPRPSSRGRTTPKKTSSSNSNGHSEFPSFEISPTLESLGFEPDDRVEAVLDPIDYLIDLEPFALDVEAVRFVGLCNVPPDLPAGALSADFHPVGTFLKLLVEMLPDGDVRVVDALYLLSIYGGEHAPIAISMLESSEIGPSSHLDTVGMMNLDGAWLVEHPAGGWHEICIVVSYTASPPSAVLLMVDEQNKGVAKRVSALPDAINLGSQIDLRDGYSRHTIPLADAVALWRDALAAADALPKSSPLFDESLLVYRPLLDYLIGLNGPDGSEDTE